LASSKSYGWGFWGTKREHYKPKPEQIRRLCKKIRERGFRDELGEWHPPWSEEEELNRRVGCNKRQEVPEMSPISIAQCPYPLLDDENLSEIPLEGEPVWDGLFS